MRKKEREKVKKIAEERIEILLKLADERTKKGDFDLAKRYVELARKIAMKCNVRFKKEQKIKVCKKCSTYLLHSVTSRVRVYKGRVIITCLNCGSIKRYPYLSEKI